MKKLGILVTVLTLGLTTVKAQEIVKKHEIRIGVSDGSLTSTAVGIGQGLADAMIYGIFSPGQKESIQNNSVAVNGEYRYQLNNRIMIGGDVVYQRLNSQVIDKATKVLDENTRLNLISILPTAEYSYYRNNIINLYGSAALGATISSSSDKINKNNNKTNIYLSGQINPIGIKIGKKFGGFAEAGFGIKGLATAGLFYKF